jgi:hypothetical protein
LVLPFTVPEVVTSVRVPHDGLTPATEPTAPATANVPDTFPVELLPVKVPAYDIAPANPPAFWPPVTLTLETAEETVASESPTMPPVQAPVPVTAPLTVTDEMVDPLAA